MTDKPMDDHVKSAGEDAIDVSPDVFEKKGWYASITLSDAIALAALLLSLGNVIWIVATAWKGVEVKSFAPGLVEFRCSSWRSSVDKCYGPKSNLTITANLAFVNSGEERYNAVIENSIVRVKLKDKAMI